MPTPKFRLFAGPNASGKTYVFNKIRKNKQIPKEIYVNADRIEAELAKKRKFYFNSYRVRTNADEFRSHILDSGLFKEKINDERIVDHLCMRSGVLTVRNDVMVNSYHASFVATYLAQKLFESRQSFVFETVMSHSSKLDFLRIARKNGYKTYLYFVFTGDLTTNLARVQLRISEGGHAVSPEAHVVLKKENSILYSVPHFPEILRKELASIIRRFSGPVREIY